jgi:hypothetical protein
MEEVMTKNQIRAFLRKELRAGRLEARTTYHDYYDSCHPPVETPDAAWVPAVERNRDPFNREKYQISIGDLKAGGAWPTLKENGIVELSTGWHTYQVRVKQ